MSSPVSPLVISERLAALRAIIPEGIELVAVSKFQPVESLKAAYEAGQRVFGESRVQELIVKIPQLPSDVKWHFIGHLQTNKVKQIVGKVEMIESVDSERLLELIDQESRKKDCISKVLLQVHVAAEETKFGFSADEVLDYFRSRKIETLTNTHISGLMAMATNTSDEAVIRKDFASVASLMREIREKINPGLRNFNVLSMGMSHDWPIAVEEGATSIRVGSAIFGPR